MIQAKRGFLGATVGAAVGAGYAALTVCNGLACRLSEMPAVPVAFCGLAGLFIALSSRYDA